MANNKTLRRQAARDAAAASADGTVTEEVLSDVLDPETEEQVPGLDVRDQAEGSLEGDSSNEEPAVGSESTAVVAEFSEGLVGDESDGVVVRDNAHFREGGLGEARGLTPVAITSEEMPFLPPAGDEPATLGEGAETPVSDEEQAASTTALLAQEPQPEPDAAVPGARFKDLLLGYSDADAPRPVINLEVGGQIGYAPAEEVAPLEESVEDEQTVLEHGDLAAELSALESFVADTAESSVEEGKSSLVSVEEAVVTADTDYTTWTTAALRTLLTPAVGKDPAEAWSRDDMLMYLIKGLYPKKTGRNNWIYDSRRGDRAKSWKASEILDFIEEKLQIDPHVDVSIVWEEAFARYKVPLNWTIEAFREYVCNGSVPEYTASGVLINDRQRDQKRSGHLTFREIRAALMGLIQTQFTNAELMTQYRKRLGISPSYSEERLLAEMPNQPDEVSMDNTILRAKLDEYKTSITKNSGTQTEQTAGECQGMLYKAIRDVIKREFNDFVEGWNIILDFVNENHAALFSPYTARRGWSQVPLGKNQLQLFEDLLTVLIATREPGNRASKQTYNLEIVLRHLPEENQRQNLFMYYSA